MMKPYKGSLVIGIDPGIRNLGWCVSDMEGRCLNWGLVTSTLEDLKTPNDIKTFKKNLRTLIRYLNRLCASNVLPDLIMERYMPRGMRRGNQVERINIIIGYLLGKLKYECAYLVPASSWKNRREKEYLEVMNETVPEHLTDTYTMTLYYLERLRGLLDTKQVRGQLKIVNKINYGWKKEKGVWVKKE